MDDGARYGKGKRPSMFEVARLAGVSHQTVSRVINGSPNVAPGTRARVLEAIDRLGYRRSNSARALASNRSRTIGLVSGSLAFYGPLSTLAAIEGVVRDHGMFLSVSIMGEGERGTADFRGAVRGFAEQDVDALVFIAPTEQALLAAVRLDARLPRMVITSAEGRLGIDDARAIAGDAAPIGFAGVDQSGAMAAVAEHLDALGHRRIWYVCGPMEWRDAATRRAACERACGERGIRVSVLEAGGWNADDGRRVVGGTLDAVRRARLPLPTAIAAGNDLLAIGALRALTERGLTVPGDVSLVGYDDYPGVDNLMPSLTTVRPDFQALGETATNGLLAMLGDGGTGSSSPELVQVPAELIARESTGPAATR